MNTGKLSFIILTLLLFAATAGRAQVNQRGVVTEYNERQQKTPLAQVELKVAGAGSTTSGKGGDFVLVFRTLKAGDKVQVHRIEKLGYELFNKEAVDQWHIGRADKPFQVVMCRTERFRKIRSNYEQVASESYARQMKKDEEALERERKQQKMSDKQYQEALTQLRNEYEERLENLDNYIDRFARIDQSELSDAENNIILLVQKGQIDEAIKQYDALNLEDKYKKEEAVIARLQTDIDQLSQLHDESIQVRDQAFAAIKRKNDLLYLAGGRDNIAKIGLSLRQVAEADTTFYPALEEYAHYLVEQNKPKEALPWLEKAERHAQNNEQRLDAILERANAMMLAGTMEGAHQLFLRLIADIEETYKDNEAVQAIMLASPFQQLTYFLVMQNLHQEAYECGKTHLALLEDIMKLGPELYREDYAQALGIIAHECLMLGLTDEGYAYAQKELQLYQSLAQKEPQKYELRVASAKHTLAEQIYQRHDFEESLRLMNEALTVVERYYAANPQKHIHLLADCVKLLGSIHRSAKHYDEAERYLTRALQLNQESLKMLPDQKMLKRVEASYNVSMGWLRHEQGRMKEAQELFGNALKTMQEMDSEDTNLTQLMEAYYGYGNTLIRQGRTRESLTFYQRALKVAERVYEQTPGTILYYYHLTLYAMSSANFYLGNSDQALVYADRDLALMQKHSQARFDQPELSAVMGAYIYNQRRQYSKAMEYTEMILKMIPSGPTHAAYLGFKGQLLDSMGKQRDARAIWLKALNETNELELQNPNDFQNLDTKGELLVRLGRHDEAQKVLEKILRIEPQYIQKYGQQSDFYKLLQTTK